SVAPRRSVTPRPTRQQPPANPRSRQPALARTTRSARPIARSSALIPAMGTTLAEIAAPGIDSPFDLSVGNGAAWSLYGVPGVGTSLVRIDTAANTGGEPITP